MKDINSLLTELAQGSTHIISKPETIEELQKQGVEFNKSKITSPEDAIKTLFSQRKGIALANITQFPSPPNIPIPTIGLLYDEVRECILFGLYGAAISLSAVLVEFSLKHAIIKKKRGDAYNKAEWDRIEGIELDPTIQEARKMEVIDETMEKRLKAFKNDVRNPYLHYNIKKITKDVVARKVKRFNVKTRQVFEVDLDAKDNPFVWSLAKKFVDKDLVMKAFLFTDEVIKFLFVVK